MIQTPEGALVRHFVTCALRGLKTKSKSQSKASVKKFSQIQMHGLLALMNECQQIHYRRQSISRADGKAASDSASYRAAEPLYSTRFEQTFRSKSNSKHMGLSKIFAPKGTPVELTQRESLWNAVESSEKRKDAILSFEFNAALPFELTVVQREAFIADFIKSHFVSRGIICDVNVHNKKDNPHFHCMMTTRPIDESTVTGFAAKKNREWFKMGSVEDDRVAFTECLNKHLTMAKVPVRYAHQTLSAQGIDRIAQVHLGPNVIAMDMRHKHEQAANNGFVDNSEMPEMLKIYNEIIDFNAASAKIKAKKAEQERIDKETEKKAKASQELSSKNKSMVQSQIQYLRLHSEISDEWRTRKRWFKEEPVIPKINTVEGLIYKKDVGLWKKTGQAIRNIVKSAIGAIRTLSSDYHDDYDRDLADDAKNLTGGGVGGAGGSSGSSADESVEINGP